MDEFTFDHVHLRSHDTHAAARFYVDMFGARELARSPRDGGTRFRLGVGGAVLMIDPIAPEVQPPATPHAGIEHVCFRVGDVTAAVEGLRARGAGIATEVYSPRPGVRIAFVAAPDAVSIELLEMSA